MHLTKYTEGWTRRHFLEQVSKGVLGRWGFVAFDGCDRQERELRSRLPS
jgi:hypothetical protein